MKSILSIGIIVSDDYHSLYNCLYNLLLHQDIQYTEIIVINNGLDKKHSTILEQEVGQHRFIKYIKLVEPQGNSLAKNTIFEMATADFVLCLDARVMFCQNAMSYIKSYINHHPDSKDIVSGPLVFKDCINFSTHQIDKWSEGVLGMWTKAWRHPTQNINFIAKDKDHKCQFLELNSLVELPPIITPMPYLQHRQTLIGLGFGQPGLNTNDLFEVPMVNTSVFLCPKAAWPGLNKDFTAFDTDAYYLSKKIRLGSGKTMCLGGMKFIYKNHSPNYFVEPMLLNKMKDCILGYQELGLPLDGAKEYFTDTLNLSGRVWDIVVANPTIPAEDIPQIRGVGTHVKLSIGKLGIVPDNACTCNQRMKLMNQMGVEGCKTNLYTIAGWLRDMAVTYGWEKSIYAEVEHQEKSLMEQIGLRVKAIKSGLAFKLDRKNPYLSIVQNAIEAAEAEEKTLPGLGPVEGG